MVGGGYPINNYKEDVESLEIAILDTVIIIYATSWCDIFGLIKHIKRLKELQLELEKLHFDAKN